MASASLCDRPLVPFETIKASLSGEGKVFVLSQNRLTPDWSIYDHQRFALTKSKRLNLEKFKNDNPAACQQQWHALQSILSA